MSDGAWKCDCCGYSVGRSWGSTSWKCPRCNGERNFVEKLIKENKRLKAKNKKLKNEINPPFLGENI